jgi:hypothetical protein
MIVLDVPAWLTLHFGTASRMYRVRILGETRDRYRARVEEPVPVPHGRVLKPGEICRLPKDAFCVREEAGGGL